MLRPSALGFEARACVVQVWCAKCFPGFPRPPGALGLEMFALMHQTSG